MTIADVAGPSALPPNSPPTKASLANWWERFKKKGGKDNGEKGTTVLRAPFFLTPLTRTTGDSVWRAFIFVSRISKLIKCL
jgi:hypothetical protein